MTSAMDFFAQEATPGWETQIPPEGDEGLPYHQREVIALETALTRPSLTAENRQVLEEQLRLAKRLGAGNRVSADQFFGGGSTVQGPNVAEPARPSASSFFGGEEPAAPAKPVPEVPTHQTDFQIAAGGVAAGLKAAVVDPLMGMAGEARALGDMVLSVPSMVLGTAADMTVRLGGLLRGMNHKEVSQLAAQAREDAGNNALISPAPITKALQAFGLQPTQSGVESLMEKLTGAIKKGGQWVDEKTGGAINADDVDSLANEVMGLYGARIGKAQVANLIKEKSPPPKPQETPLPTEAPPKSDFYVDSQGNVGKNLDSTARAQEEAQATAQAEAKAPGEPGTQAAQAAAATVAGVGAALAVAYGDDGEDLASKAAMAGVGAVGMIRALPPTTPLGAVLARSHSTLKTLERLDPGKFDFGLQEVRDQLKREDVPKAEKEILGSVLDAKQGAGAKRISAVDLVQGFKDAVGDFELQRVERVNDKEAYTDYGLDRIGRGYVENEYSVEELRGQLEDMQDYLRSTTQDFRMPSALRQSELQRIQGEITRLESEITQSEANGLTDSRTSLYSLPLGTLNLPPGANHFNMPDLFGWTRSFDEGGVRHVVEVQSDLAQKLKELPPEELAAAKAQMDNAYRVYQSLIKERDKALEAYIRAEQRHKELNPSSPLPHDLLDLRQIANGMRARAQEAGFRHSELQGVVENAELASRVKSSHAPMLRDWWKRLVREELAAAAKEVAVREDFRRGAEVQRDRTDIDQRGTYQDLLDRTPEMPKVTRFATADTVAKVEGWPNARAELEEQGQTLRDKLADVQGDLALYTRRTAEARAALEQNPEAQSLQMRVQSGEAHIQAAKERIAALEKEVKDVEGRLASEMQVFKPEHQGIYDRYRRDLEPFLRRLAKDAGGSGDPVTDSAGHTWIEVPHRPGAIATRAQMYGRIEPRHLLNLAAVAAGAYLGTLLDEKNPVSAAILGGLAAALTVSGAVGKGLQVLRDMRKPDSRIRIDDLTQAREHHEFQVSRSVAALQAAIFKAVGKAKDREAIQVALQNGTVGSLPPALQPVALQVERFFNSISTTATQMGLRPSVPFSHGFKDVAESVGAFGHEMGRAIADKIFLDQLTHAKGPQGQPFLIPKKKQGAVPQSSLYISVSHPKLARFLVHPDIAPSLRFMFENQDPGAFMSALSAVNTALKRAAVSFSLFHAKALYDAALGALRAGPITATKVLAQSLLPRVLGEQRMVKALRMGGPGDIVDFAGASGLKLSVDRGIAGVEDLSGSFYQGMRWLEGQLNKTFPGLGAPISLVAKLNHLFDEITWNRLHTAFKLEVFASKVEALLDSNARAGTPITRAAAGKAAASYTNDIFGGLNWQRLAEGTTSQWGRDMALSLLSPRGRRAVQLAVFAPDWTLSTLRAFTQALGKGSGLGGLLRPKVLADLHRQQLVRSLIYYTVIGDAVNYTMTGHHLWENQNKDWATRVELGDGRTVQLSKHTMEPFHWFMHPAQTALNKLGIIPRQLAEQAMNQKYLSPNGAPPIVAKGASKAEALQARAGHIFNSANPIGVQ